jgi:hypothetical protein
MSLSFKPRKTKPQQEVSLPALPARSSALRSAFLQLDATGTPARRRRQRPPGPDGYQPGSPVAGPVAANGR